MRKEGERRRAIESDGFGYINIKEQEVERVLDLITGEQFFQLFSL